MPVWLIPIFLVPVEGAILFVVLRVIPHKVDAAAAQIEEAVAAQVQEATGDIAQRLLQAAVAMSQPAPKPEQPGK